MEQSIVCISDQETKNFSDFLFLESNPDPCCLNYGDFFESDEPRRWAETLFEPEDIIELRLRPPREASNGFLSRSTAKSHSIYPWIHAKNVDAVVPKLERLNQGATTCWGSFDKESQAWFESERRQDIPLNIYVSANPRKSKGGKRSEDVALARSLFVDLEKISVEEALQKVLDLMMPLPTMTVCSGHGVHLYWRLNEPITDLSTWTAIQKRFIRAFNSDPAIHDPPRVMRVPGFNNVNGELARCYIHEADASRRYFLNDLVELLPPDPTDVTDDSSEDEHRNHNQDLNLITITNGISIHGINGDSPKKQARVNAYSAKFESVETNRNSAIFKQTCNLVEKFDLTQEQALEQLEKVNDKSSNPLDQDELEEVFGKAFNLVKRKGKRKNAEQPLRLEKFVEPILPIIEIDTWREQMAKARLESLSHFGKIFFDGSTAGAGKSTADLEAMKVAGKSATFLPTHDACKELLVKLSEQGLQAAAHPPLDSNTCQLFGTKSNPGPAQLAQKAGLNVGLCVCTSCEFSKKGCVYQIQREIARNSDHTIATHARGSLSDFQPAENKPVVFFHEDVVDLLKPMVKVVRRSNKKTDPQLSHLEEILRIAEAAEQLAITWSDESAIEFAKHFVASTKELIAELSNDDLVKPFIDPEASGKHSNALCSVKALPTRQLIQRFERADYLLKRAMTSINLFSNGSALRLSTAYCHGELESLTAVVDEAKLKGGKPHFTKGLVGVWKNILPNDTVVWVENASTTATALQELTQSKIEDKTPFGRLDYKFPPIQYPDCDITQNSSDNTVRSVLRGLLAKFSDKKKIGVITHQSHVAEIDKLAPLWKSRINRIEYFHSGKDRASNSWLNCDLILVIGTPRVPPSAIRDHLIRIGRNSALTSNNSFCSFVWEGKRLNGELVKIEGLGYSNHAWQEANNSFVKETLLQAVGRGRGVTDKGVPVVVASCESLGLPIADSPLQLIGDSEDETLRLMITASMTKQLSNLSDKNAKYITLGDLSDKSPVTSEITTSEVTELSLCDNRSVRRHLSLLSLSGLLSRRGQRGGWKLATWLLTE